MLLSCYYYLMNRIDWIDVAKGYGIIGVIIGHISTPVITVWIYTFHIPLFFFLSGYLFHPKSSFLEFCKRKVRSLLVPYLFLSIPVILNEYWFNYGNSGSLLDLVNEFFKAIVQVRYTPLWFISSLFCVNIIFYFVIKYINKVWIRSLCVLLSLVLSFAYWHFGGAPLPWNFDITLFVLPLLLLASVVNSLCKWKCIVKNRPLLFLAIFFVGNTLLGGINYYFIGKKVDLYYGDVDTILFSCPAALCGIFFIIILSWIKNLKFLTYLGRNSLLIFAWHLIVYKWLGCLYDWIGLFQTPLSIGVVIVRDFISLILILAFLVPINEAILHSKLKFVLCK